MKKKLFLLFFLILCAATAYLTYTPMVIGHLLLHYGAVGSSPLLWWRSQFPLVRSPYRLLRAIAI